MSFTFAQLRTELASRGFDDLTSAQQGQAINDAIQEIDSWALWEYLETSVSGTPAPLLIPDLRKVEQVIDETNNSYVLRRRSWAELVQIYGDLSVSTGNPMFWYSASPEGVVQVATFPESSNTIGVQYWKRTAALSADADVPDLPSQWHSLIVDVAQANSYPDGDAPGGVLARIERRKAAMFESEPRHNTPGFVSTRGGSY